MSIVRPLFALALGACFLGLNGCGGGGETPLPAPPAPAPEMPTRAPVPLTSGITIGTPAWPEGSSASGATGPTPMAGVSCLVNESYHVHAHISLFKDGVQLAVPANIGLRGCAFELHTHDESGIVHVETNVAKPFTLGQFFAVWGHELNATGVAGMQGNVEVWVTDEGKAPAKVTGFAGPADFAAARAVELVQHREIAIVVGARPAALPTYTWTGGY
ncbi:MAG: hypothetical protein ACLGI6_08610 [Gammaproteobacteria bacterium]